MSRGRKLSGIVVSAGVIAAVIAAGWFAWQYWWDHRFDALITQTAAKHELSPYLVKAVAWRESRLDPGCRGPVDEIGLMQIRPSTAREWARLHGAAGFDPDALHEPAVNLDIGCWYLRRAINRWTNSTANPLPFALAEYNAGRSNALRWASGPKPFDPRQFVEKITYPTTRKYVRVVEERCQHYARRGRL